MLTQCTSVVGPWVVIPAADPVPVPAGVTVSCPDSDNFLLAVGSDYQVKLHCSRTTANGYWFAGRP